MTMYVYNGTVVVKTGRIARKETGGTRRRSTSVEYDELFEITPQDIEDGSWKKWVRQNELYEIIDEETDK